MSQRRNLVDNQHKLSVRRQSELLSVHRSGLYYAPKGESQENLKIMRIMDEHYLEHPSEGVIRMQDMLFVVGHQEASVHQTCHAGVVGRLTCQQRCAAGRARRRGAEGLSKQYALLRQTLDVGCRYLIPIGLDITPRIMGMDIDDVWSVGRRHTSSSK